jgi:hypothetical protein
MHGTMSLKKSPHKSLYIFARYLPHMRIFVSVYPNENVLLRVKEQRNILHEIRKRKANWIGHILLRTCLLQRVIKGKIQGGI